MAASICSLFHFLIDRMIFRNPTNDQIETTKTSPQTTNTADETTKDASKATKTLHQTTKTLKSFLSLYQGKGSFFTYQIRYTNRKSCLGQFEVLNALARTKSVVLAYICKLLLSVLSFIRTFNYPDESYRIMSKLVYNFDDYTRNPLCSSGLLRFHISSLCSFKNSARTRFDVSSISATMILPFMERSNRFI